MQRIHAFRKALPFLLAVAMLLPSLRPAFAATAEKEEEAEVSRIYYVSSDGTRLLSCQYELQSSGDEAIRELFTAICGGNFSDGNSAVPSGVTLNHIAWQEDSLVLYLEGNYPEAGTAEETLCRLVIVKTLLAKAGVESVIINVNNEPLKSADGSEVGRIRESDFLMDVATSPDETRKVIVTLYFANENGTALVTEDIMAELSMDETIESGVMRLLIAGPTEKDHRATIPQGVSLLSVSVRNRICYVNVSGAFTSQDNPVSQMLSVYSIVNSLSILADVDQVQLAVDGSSDITMQENISLAAPLSADWSLVEQ